MVQLIPYLKKEEIENQIVSIAKKISADYSHGDLVIVGILKGCFIFISDLVRHLTVPVQIDFISVSSYGSETDSSGEIRMNKELQLDIKNKDVLLIDDIVDTGLTLSSISEYIRSFGPKSVRRCALIDKSERREKSIALDYVCYKIKEGFLVGYGLDYAEKYRNLPGIYQLKL
ncbi:MAG: hypoxanthine phosphoribosyltransferase [Desulfobacterales bacterium]|nr:hypoxanthine phosphoribosyltransferase [Desulfobacterales bacterium]MDD4072965.1 hypoxanthine phosphoribosyltransferase [Desulfobacterales bacterium]MDD4392274.1 hypoxanthine phosphoribosyltransferase [Desulfobacterales bacterium]